MKYISRFINYVKKYFNLEESFVFYGAYHNERRNQLVHIMFVPIIFTTALAFVSKWKIQSSSLNVSHIAASFYGLTFVCMDPIAGILYLPCIAGMRHIGAIAANKCLAACGALHVVGWVSQILAHRIFEGEQPAFMEDPFQALHSAVFFVWLEVLFKLGYRRNQHKKLQHLIDLRIKELEKQGKRKPLTRKTE